MHQSHRHALSDVSQTGHGRGKRVNDRFPGMAIALVIVYIILIVLALAIGYAVIRAAVRAALADHYKTVRWYEHTGEWKGGKAPRAFDAERRN